MGGVLVRALLLALLLMLLPQPVDATMWIVGDAEFAAKVNDADSIVRYGGDKWRDYVYTRIDLVQQWNGDADGHFGKVDVNAEGYGTFLVRRDGYDALWLAMALVQEAAHVEKERQGKPLDGCAEIEADMITHRFARAVGLDWHIRASDEVWGGCENGN